METLREDSEIKRWSIANKVRKGKGRKGITCKGPNGKEALAQRSTPGRVQAHWEIKP